MGEFSFPNEATPDGSAAYYSIRFSRSRKQDQLALCFSWRHHLNHIRQKATDPGVARLKLNWWEKEIANLAPDSDQADLQHPLAIALQQIVYGHEERKLLIEMLEATDTDIARKNLTSQEEHQQHLDMIGGAFGELLYLVNTNDDKQQPSSRFIGVARHLGSYSEAVYRMSALLHLPEQFSYAQPSELKSKTSPSAIAHNTLEPLHDEAKRHMDATLPDSLRPIINWTKQAEVLHKKMARLGYPMGTKIELSPIRKLWAAWRLK